MDYINSERYLKDRKKIVLKGFKNVEIPAKINLNKQLNKIADKKFRTLKHLQILCKANALSRGVKEVSQIDVQEILRLAKYFNLKYTPI